MWRFHLQSLPSKVWIDRDVPLQGARVVEAVSGPGSISGSLPGNYPYRADVQEWGALLVAEQEGRDPVAAIIDSVTTERGRLKVEAGGFSMYPQGMPWTDPDYAGVRVDPLEIVRLIWSKLQARPNGNLGVAVSDATSTARLGTPESPALTTAKAALADATADEQAGRVAYTQASTAKNAAKNALLAAANRPTSGVVIVQDSAPSGSKRSTKNLWFDTNNSNLAHVWNGKGWTLTLGEGAATQTELTALRATYNDKTVITNNAATVWKSYKTRLAAAKKRVTDIKDGKAEPFTLTWWDTHDLGNIIDELAKDTPFDYRERSIWVGEGIAHELELGAPALGGRRPDLRFEVGVNVTAPPPLKERDYASEAVVLGAGEGRAMVRATASGNPGRLRRAVVIQRKDIKANAPASAVARAEVAKRSAVWTFDSLDVSDHPFAPYGSFRPGDIVHVLGDAGWIQLDHWVRIQSIETDCVTGAINLRVGIT
jgi:hypothetical protein